MKHSHVHVREGTKSYEEYILGVVASITREGQVKAIVDGRGVRHSPSSGASFATIWVSSKNQFSRPVKEMVEAVQGLLDWEPIRSFQDARDLLTPWLVDAEVRPWPNGLEWSVGGLANVVREVDGSLTAAVAGPVPSSLTIPAEEVPDPVDDESVRAYLRDVFVEASHDRPGSVLD